MINVFHYTIFVQALFSTGFFSELNIDLYITFQLRFQIKYLVLNMLFFAQFF